MCSVKWCVWWELGAAGRHTHPHHQWINFDWSQNTQLSRWHTVLVVIFCSIFFSSKHAGIIRRLFRFAPASPLIAPYIIARLHTSSRRCGQGQSAPKKSNDSWKLLRSCFTVVLWWLVFRCGLFSSLTKPLIWWTVVNIWDFSVWGIHFT